VTSSEGNAVIAGRAPWRAGGPRPAAALTAAVLGFFVITLDTSIVNVALPAMSRELRAGMTGLQWVVDGYVLIFAALQLSAGSLTDRVGARRAFAAGMSVFVLASAGCGLAPNLAVLVAARLVQGAGAALMTPSSLTLIREAYPDPAKRGRALAVWITGGSVAGAVGPLAGGALSLASWRLIFYVNLPVGLVALGILARVARSPRRPSPFDVIGQAAAVVGMGGLTYGVIEAGGDGAAVWKVRSAFAVALVAAVVFLLAQARASHPMVPLGLLRSRLMVIASLTGFAFLGSFTGTVFVYSLYLQDVHGQSSLATGLEFLPMAVLAGIVSVLGGRLSERFGPRPPIIVGMAVMGVESIVLAALPVSVPIWAVSVLMIPLGASGPLAIPATTAVLLESVPAHRSGIAAGVFNTSRQVGAALAVAVFGALLADRARFERGLRESLLIAAAVSLAAAAVNTLTRMPVREVVPALPGQAGGARLASTSEGREP
jgi:EmrB/QacA subfamily drug resistance transporter